MFDTTAAHQFSQLTLRRSAQAWFFVAMLGQLGFITFIALYYGARTISGDFESWNDKPLINGYISGDMAGNVMFILHALLAMVVTAGGLMQLIPWLRNNAKTLHRITGRLFFVISIFLSVGGVWLVWVRGTRLSTAGGVSGTLNAALILWFCIAAWWHARGRRFVAHRRYALRAFMVVNGVWFLRIGIMAWVIVNQGGRGMTATMDGPADIVLMFGSYLIPLALTELYLRCQNSRRAVVTFGAAVVIGISTLVTAIGVFGTIMLMWRPHL
ncbi:MAG: DUF2306 domain-containing protein [Pseudomonadota bacterium]